MAFCNWCVVDISAEYCGKPVLRLEHRKSQIDLEQSQDEDWVEIFYMSNVLTRDQE